MSVSDLVGEIEGVRRRTRRATRGGAVPLALLALLVMGAAPVYGTAATREFGYRPGGVSGYVSYYERITLFERLLRAHPNQTDSAGIGVYWLVAAPLTFAAIAAYYAWRARRTGLSIDGWRVAAVGGALFAALVGLMAYAGGNLRPDPFYGFRVTDLLNPFLVVALAAFALAWVERSVTVLLAAVSFTVVLVLADIVVYGPVNSMSGWEMWVSWGWGTLILGAFLMIWAGVVALVRRPRA